MKTVQKGFTLIELLVVIAIIAILAVVVFVALNPAGRFADARNARRWSDVNSILSAVHEYLVDNDGAYPGTLAAGMSQTQLGSAATGCDDDGCGAVAACEDLSTDLAPYLKSIPIDPTLADTSTETHYSVEVDANGIVTITACDAEAGETIQVSR